MLSDPLASVLLVDQDQALVSQIRGLLLDVPYAVEEVDDDEKAFNRLDTRLFDVLICTLNASRVDGMRLMAVARERNPEVCVIFMVERPDIELATEAMRQGAYAYEVKPLNLDKLAMIVERGIAHQRLLFERQGLRRRLDAEYSLSNLVGKSRQMIHLYGMARQAAGTDTTVLIQGEPGTGKELIAQAIHNNSARRDEPFVTCDCAGMQGTQMWGDLLGHGAGAFPGAAEGRPGRVELADKGTLFLDDVGELSPKLQEALAGILRDGRFSRLGETRKRKVDLRVIAATEQPMEGLPVHQDLSRLLTRVTIDIPPLRERPEDVRALTEHFIREYCRRHHRSEPVVAQAAYDLLARYEWPGNVRELKRVVEEILARPSARGRVEVADIPPRIRRSALPDPTDIRIPAGSTMREVERIVIEDTLRACDYSKEACAQALGIGLRTLYRKLKQYEEDSEQ